MLEELRQFPALEQRAATEFAAGIAAEMARLYALPVQG